MIKGNGLVRLYDRLTPDERFRLALEAVARNDEQEARRLADTCPRRTYRAPDVAYTRLLDASQRVASAFAVLWLLTSRRYLVAAMAFSMAQAGMDAFAEGANSAWRLAGREGELLSKEPLQGGPLEALVRERAAELRGIHAGLLRFCQAVQVKPDALLALYKPVLADIDALAAALSGVAASEEVAGEVEGLLRKLWSGDEG